MSTSALSKPNCHFEKLLAFFFEALNTAFLRCGLGRPRWKYMWNPWEWFKWFYENAGHKQPALSASAFVVVFAVIGLMVWWRLDTQYRKDHPADRAIRSSSVAIC